MRQGLKEGETAWEAFGNAVLNVLDKIIDKMMDIGVDMLFMAGRSYFGDISSGSTWNPATSAPAVKPTMAANGGVFSNGIYSSPTVFQFAKGGKFGVMGEAGPEAVMPLTRGPDGSLGVKASNNNSSPVVVNVINNSSAQAHVEQRQTSQGVELDVVIDQLVAEKMNKPGTSSNTALRTFSNQKLIAR
jgi:lambda family phage tail tape measure protein